MTAQISLSALGANPDRVQAIVGPTPTTLLTATGTTGSTARTKLVSAIIANPSPSTLKVRLGLIPQGTTADGTHYLLGDQAIAANSSQILADLPVMRPGDVLEAYSDPLPAPINFTASNSTTGGTLPAATYWYKITATNAGGESIGSLEASTTTTGTTSTATLGWSRMLGATGYKIYRSTATGTEIFLAAVSNGATTSYTDTGAVAPAGSAPPATGTAAGCIFTVSYTDVPA